MTDTQSWPPPPDTGVLPTIPDDPQALLGVLIDAPKNAPVSAMQLTLAFAGMIKIKDPATFVNQALAARGIAAPVATPVADPTVPGRARPFAQLWPAALFLLLAFGLRYLGPLLRATGPYRILLLLGGAGVATLIGLGYIVRLVVGRSVRLSEARDQACNANRQYDPTMHVIAYGFRAEAFPARKMEVTLQNCAGLPLESAVAACKGFCARTGRNAAEAPSWLLLPVQSALIWFGIAGMFWSLTVASVQPTRAAILAVAAHAHQVLIAFFAASFVLMFVGLALDAQARKKI